MERDRDHEVLVSQVERSAEHADAERTPDLHRGVVGRRTHTGLFFGQRPHDGLGARGQAQPRADAEEKQ